MNTRSGYVIDDTADLQSTRHLTQATSCRTTWQMPFLSSVTEPSTAPLSQVRRAFAYHDTPTGTPSVGGSRLSTISDIVAAAIVLSTLQRGNY